MSPVGLREIQEGGQTSKASFEISYSLDLDLHTKANNFAPNEFREVVNLFGLVVYKGSKRKGNRSGDCNGKEIKAVNIGGVNNGGTMDRGPMTFTSDVSLPKDDKQLCWVNKLQLGN